MLKDNMFSNLKIVTIKDKKIYIVDKHHFVLPVWFSHKLEDKAMYDLITFDYHTDTREPFWTFITSKCDKSYRKNFVTFTF